jgi:hypothetical protein
MASNFFDHWVLVVAGVAMGLHLLASLVLIPILNPLFDPDWRPPLSTGPRAAYARTLRYSGAVATRRGLVTIGAADYDFAGRVGPVTRLLCHVNLWSAMLAGAGALVYGGWRAWLTLFGHQ